MDPQVGGELSLDRFRHYLLLLAQLHLGNPVRGKLDASDVVQEIVENLHEFATPFEDSGHATQRKWTMDTPQSEKSERERRLDEVITAYLKAIEAGQKPDQAHRSSLRRSRPATR
jgi:hypothetical protein